MAVADAAEGLKHYGGALAADKKLRERLLTALVAGVGAQQRATRQTGMAGTVRRLAGDPVLRAQLTEMLVQLQKARQRVERRRSHKLRNSVLVLAGFGAASAAVAVPAVRDRILGVVGDVRQKVGAAVSAAAPTTVMEEIVVEAPLSTTYNQWTQFEEFPRFMEGVEQVEQIDDTRLRWVAKVGGKRAEWEAKILFQEPDSRIGWRSTDGKETSGTVSFEPDGDARTRIKLAMTYLPEGVLEQAGSAIGLDRRRIRGDLDRFKELIEERDSEAGGWRGEIEGGRAKASASSQS